MTTPSNKPPFNFWVLVLLALIWNLMGVNAYIMQVTMTAEDLAALPADQKALYEAVPIWATGSFAFAVFGGVLGCLFLLFRKSLALYLFIISLIGIFLQMFYNLILSKSLEVYGPGQAIMPVMIILIGIALIWYTIKAEKKGWIH